MPGFTTDIATSSLPADVKTALLDYDARKADSQITWNANGVPQYDGQDIGQATRVWAHRYIARHPLASE